MAYGRRADLKSARRPWQSAASSRPTISLRSSPRLVKNPLNAHYFKNQDFVVALHRTRIGPIFNRQGDRTADFSICDQGISDMLQHTRRYFNGLTDMSAKL